MSKPFVTRAIVTLIAINSAVILFVRPLGLRVASMAITLLVITGLLIARRVRHDHD